MGISHRNKQVHIFAHLTIVNIFFLTKLKINDYNLVFLHHDTVGTSGLYLSVSISIDDSTFVV